MIMVNARIAQEYPDQTEILDLLNNAFDDWGDKERLRWKFDEYPRFNGDHVFTIKDGDELIAFRRLFKKQIITNDGEQIDFFVGGDTCVAEEYRGHGLFSALLEETQSYSREQGAPFSASFNRKGVITFKMKKDRGWNYRPLPLYIRVLTPEVVIPHYASLVLEQFPTIEPPASLALKSMPAQAILRLLPDTVVAALVEIATSDVVGDAITHRLHNGRTKNSVQALEAAICDPSTVRERLNEILALYDMITKKYDSHFRRSREHIEHMLAHPSLETVAVVEQDSTLVGFAPLALVSENGAEQVNVLDCVSRDAATFSRLVNIVEAEAEYLGADLVVMITDREPNQKWSRVDQQVLMWDQDVPALEGSLFVGLYDVV